MNERLTLEDFTVGDTVRSPARTVTAEDLKMTDEILVRERPASASYSDRTPSRGILGELFLLAMSSGLMFRAGGAALPPSTELLWSITDVRFEKRVETGDTIRLESEVVSLANVDESRGLIGVRHTAFDQRSAPVFAFSTKMVVPRRGGGDAPCTG